MKSEECAEIEESIDTRFKIIEKIGTGGTANVFKVNDLLYIFLMLFLFLKNFLFIFQINFYFK